MSRHVLMASLVLLATVAAADGLRDPTRPPSTGRAAAPSTPAPVLSAVLSVDGALSAIFNGRLVHSGAVVDGYAIEEIFANGVRIRHAGVSQELRLPQPSPVIKKPANDGEPATGGAQ